MLSVGRGGTHPYYDRPMVQRLGEIFGWPEKPEELPTQQFDGAVEHLHTLARSDWHQMKDWWAFLMDLTYLDNIVFPREFFDYCFPALLIRWWEGQLSREGGPDHESDLYHALDRGQCLWVMMDETRRQAVLEWMTDAYIQGVDAWSGHLSVNYSSTGPDNLHRALYSFNALGQSVPILGPVWDRLKDVFSAGRAQWWLVYLTGLAFETNQCPTIPKWTPLRGGGGIYLLESDASISHGFLDHNLAAIQPDLNPSFLNSMIPMVRSNLSSGSEVEWLALVENKIAEDRGRFAARVVKYTEMLSQPDLGGPLAEL